MIVAVMAAMSSMASAYYYWVFYPSATGPYTPLLGHFDLNALHDNTVQFFISDTAPSALMPGDSTTAIYSQIERAASAWNNVGTSALRLHFGGITKLGIPQSVPGIDVVFDDDMPPGIVAQTRPTFPADLTFLNAEGTTFVPILRSQVQLRSNLTLAGYEQPSYSDAFFTTLVHEFGHALGLQHTLTSGVMSTAITRATTKGIPLSPDDVAGISLLYPRPGYVATTGSITGRVTLAGAGVNLASVVALSTTGVAISAMTNPDGTYRLEGVPPGQYYLYVHPLPPAQLGEVTPANIVVPQDPQNDDFSANTGFGTEFFPGTRDWTQATVIGVVSGKTVEQVDFAVTARPGGPAVYAMETYGYQNGVAIAAPPLPVKTRNALVFYAPGSTVDNQTAMAPGLNVSVIGDAAQVEAGSLQYYTQGFLLMAVDTGDLPTPTHVALAVTLNDDLYVLPAAFTVTPNQPPSITALNTVVGLLGVGVTTVTGANLSAGTRILLDGAPATVVSANEDGSLLISEPPGLSGYQATVEAVNPDGQTSLQALGAADRPLFSYPLRDSVEIVPTPGAVTAGTDTLMVISGVNTHFAAGQTVVGFGSSDIAVRSTWVVSPQMVILNLSVAPGALPGTASVTVSTGLEIVTRPDILNVVAADPAQISLRVPIVNAVTGLAGVPAGGTALIRTSGLPENMDGWQLRIGPDTTSFTVGDDGTLTVPVPADLAVGQQPVELVAPGAPPAAVVPRVILQLDPPPPVILAAVDSTAADGAGVAVTPSTPAQLGDTVTLTVSGLAGGTGGLPAAGGVWINIGAGVYPALAVAPVPQDPGAPPQDLALVQFVLPEDLAVDPTLSRPTVPLMVGTGTRLSAAYLLDVSPPPPPTDTTPAAQ
jgi:hypothetical protein